MTTEQRELADQLAALINAEFGAGTATATDLPNIDTARLPEDGLTTLVAAFGDTSDDQTRAQWEDLTQLAITFAARLPAQNAAKSAKIAEHLAKIESIRRHIRTNYRLGEFAALQAIRRPNLFDFERATTDNLFHSVTICDYRLAVEH